MKALPSLGCVQKDVSEGGRVTSGWFASCFLPCVLLSSAKASTQWDLALLEVAGGDQSGFSDCSPAMPCVHVTRARWLMHLPTVTCKFMPFLVLTSTI